MTADQLLHASIPDKRTELVRGVLVVREPTGYNHGRVIAQLTGRLWSHVERAAAGQLLGAETGFTLFRDPDTVRAPDIAFLHRDWLEAGARLVWVIDPDRRTARVYRADGRETSVTEKEDLTGEDVLPGFVCPLATIL